MDDHQRGDTLGQGFGPPPIGPPIGGGAELAAMALELDRANRWIVSLLGALTTITVVLAHAAHAGS